MTVKEIEKILKADGWYFITAKGSHNQYKHIIRDGSPRLESGLPFKPGKLTIPNHKGDIPIGTVRAILKQAGLK